MKIIKYMAIIALALILIKVVWVWLATKNIGSWESEKSDILGRSNFLLERVVTSPDMLMEEMPKGIGSQFQGEWALYSCSMYAKALANISTLYPETLADNALKIDSLIAIVLAPELRRYDSVRWGEDPLATLDGPNSHLSYLSHLAWMIGNYKAVSTDGKYDDIYENLCAVMNRRIKDAPALNLPTYPGETIYLPDMFVAIVALDDYAKMNDGKYSDTVGEWLARAKNEWLDPSTGLLVSFVDIDGRKLEDMPVKGSYSALNCYYLSLIDYDFGRDQYDKLKSHFFKGGLFSGIKEYIDRAPLLEEDIDAGVIVFGLSPSGCAFTIGPSTVYQDHDTRLKLLRTAELAGYTIGGEKRHYLIGNVALVGEAITLAMRTSTINHTNK